MSMPIEMDMKNRRRVALNQHGDSPDKGEKRVAADEYVCHGVMQMVRIVLLNG